MQRATTFENKWTSPREELNGLKETQFDNLLVLEVPGCFVSPYPLEESFLIFVGAGGTSHFVDNDVNNKYNRCDGLWQLSRVRKCYFPSISLTLQFLRTPGRGGRNRRQDRTPKLITTLTAFVPSLLKGLVTLDPMESESQQVSQGSYWEALTPHYQNQLAGQLSSSVKAINH